MPPRSQLIASSAPVTTPTTVKSSPPGSESFTSSASTPGSTARSACTGRLGILLVLTLLPQQVCCGCLRLLRLLRSHDRTQHEDELRVVRSVQPGRGVLRVDLEDEVA